MRTQSNPPLTLGAWFRHDPISHALDLVQPSSVLEIGAGQGAMGARIAEGVSHYVAVEHDATSHQRASNLVVPRGGTVLRHLSEVPERDFDVVCAFEVLEHIEDDQAALREWATYLRPGGYLLISVPAFADRMGPWDELVGHYRRYNPDTLRDLLKSADFEPESMVATGFPLGIVLEKARNKIASNRLRSAGVQDSESAESFDARTASSGRLLQPARAGLLTRAASAPFRLTQRLFKMRGTGLVTLGRHTGST